MPNSRHWQQSGVRRGWRIHEDLQHQAWLLVLQRRRPPSVQRPRAQQPPRQAGSSKPPSPQKSSTPSPSVQVALAKARAQSILPHPAQQVEDCQGFCTRASRRLEKARAAVVAAQEAVVRLEAELREGLQRLEELKASAVVPTIPPVNVVPSTLPSDHAGEVKLLRASVRELTREREQPARTCCATSASCHRTQPDPPSPGSFGGQGHSLRGSRHRSPSAKPFRTVLIGDCEVHRSRLGGVKRSPCRGSVETGTRIRA